MPTPALPTLLDEEDAQSLSLLSQKFGRETANYFSGSPLNRVSFLRGERDFLRAAFSHPSARFLLLKNLAPLVQKDDSSQLAFVSLREVEALTGNDPFEKSEEDMIREYDSSRRPGPVILFLGVDDRALLHPGMLSSKAAGLETQKEEEVFSWKDFRGAPYFAVDVSPRDGEDEAAEQVIRGVTTEGETGGQVFYESGRHMSLHAGQAAIYGQARALFDWNSRNPFCAQCGQPTLSVHAGTKRVCPPTDMAGGSVTDRKPCATRGTVSNLSFPRTDPTVIMAIVSADGTKILLGRQRRWPKYWYSTLAGFQEPGESIEEAVRREVWEESGVRVGRVVLHSSQPWPFPASLMIGAVGQALPGDGEKIFLGHDPELEDAKWFALEEVKNALVHGTSNLGEKASEGYVEGGLRLPPQTAIANQLMRAVVEGWWVMSRI
ncbi:NUDIX hydrolase domain-like protein [Rhypophila decipiens]|uniref:NAD(+) diphosphatase n=1 Tax=Rhypophila decipiens TaxID=261697 RepID=A0AAN7B4T8_9PEZI|nr:NUDIX hydrolase domain-like protein [Rhypophila decipiens]